MSSSHPKTHDRVSAAVEEITGEHTIRAKMCIDLDR